MRCRLRLRAGLRAAGRNGSEARRAPIAKAIAHRRKLSEPGKARASKVTEAACQAQVARDALAPRPAGTRCTASPSCSGRARLLRASCTRRRRDHRRVGIEDGGRWHVARADRRWMITDRIGTSHQQQHQAVGHQASYKPTRTTRAHAPCSSILHATGCRRVGKASYRSCRTIRVRRTAALRRGGRCR